MPIQLIEKRPILIPGDPNSHKTNPSQAVEKSLPGGCPFPKHGVGFPFDLPAACLGAEPVRQASLDVAQAGASEAPSVGTLLGMWTPGKAGRGGVQRHASGFTQGCQKILKESIIIKMFLNM